MTAQVHKVFCLSCPRSGSTWMAVMVRKLCGNVRAVHEPQPKLLGLVRDYYHGIDVAGGQTTAEWQRARWPALRDCEAKGIPLYVETGWQLFCFSRILRAAFPDCKLLGLVRHGGEFARSFLAMNAIKGELNRVRPAANWDELTDVQKAAWTWVVYTRAYLHQTDILVKVEDLWGEDGFDHWSRVCAAVGLPETTKEKYDAQRVRPVNVSKNVTAPFSEWSVFRSHQFWEIAGPLMEELGYE